MSTQNVAASVRQRLLNRSRETGEDYNLLLTRFGNERLLYRIGASPHADRFVLKGAMLFAAWTGTPHRPTRDLDLLGRGDPSPGAVADLIRAACERAPDQDDGLRFDTVAIAAHEIREAQEYGGVRVAVPATLGNARVPLRVDVGFGDVVTPAARPLTYPTLLPNFAPPVLAAYPPETVVAEKVQAMVELGMANTRLKDFFDVWLLLRDFDLDDVSLAAAIRATFARRRTPLPVELPTAFTDAFGSDLVKRAEWAAFVRRAGLSGTAPSLDQVVLALRDRLAPSFGRR